MEPGMKLDRQNKIQLQDICSENSDGGLMAYDFESLVRDVCADKLDESCSSFVDYLGNSSIENENSNLCTSLLVGPQSEVSQIKDNSDSDVFSQLNHQIGTGAPPTEEISVINNYSDSATDSQPTNEDGSTCNQINTGSQAEGIQATGGDVLPETPKHSVTILPSTSDDGEVKYVIVVHPTVSNPGESCEASDTIQPPELEHTSTITKRKIRKIPTYPVQKCDLCDYTNPFKALINRHRKTHSDARPFTCLLCDKSFKDKRNYDYHKNAHSGTKPFTCRQCNKTFATIGEQGRHVRYMHTGEKPHKCDRCEFRSVELHKLKRHIRRHLGEDRFPCTKCPFTTSDSFKLEYHTSVMHSDDYYCEECDLNFTMAGALQDHKLDHIKGDPVFACALCPLTCAFKQTLTEHMQVLHKFGSPIICKDCGKSLMDRNSYKIHCRTHRGHKFKCKLCPFKATYKSQINVHMYMHTDSFSSYERRKRLTEYKPSKNRIQVEYKPIKNRIQAECKVKIPNTVLSTLAKQKKHECPTCEKEFKDFETLKKHFIVHLASANRGIKMDMPKITVEVDKTEKVVSLEDLDELSVFDALKSPIDISDDVSPDGVLPNVLPEAISLDDVSPDGLSPDGISLGGLLPIGVLPDGVLSDSLSPVGILPDDVLPDGTSLDGVLPDVLSSEGIAPNSMLTDGMSLDDVSPDILLPNGLLSEGVLPDGVFPDNVLPISISLDDVLPDGVLRDDVFPDGVLPDGVFPDGVLPISISLDGVLSDGLLPDGISPGGALPAGVFPDSALPISISLDGILPDGLSSDGILPDCVSSDTVFADGMSPYGLSPDYILPDKVPEIHIESNSKSNIAEDIVDEFEKMQEEYAKANNNNDEYAKDETVNIECDLISCLGLDELVENMDDDDDISLSSVF